MERSKYDVIIIGGSYSGLAAGLALGRALRHVLIIDDGNPCNRQTPYSHNFLTQDGKTPKEIAMLGKQQLEMYTSVKFYSGQAVKGIKTSDGFEIYLASGEMFGAKKLIFATGIKDFFPEIDGFAACWGISVLHCPYCHGYEERNQNTGVLGNGNAAFDFCRLISNWTNHLTLFTNGRSTLTAAQTENLAKHQIRLVEEQVESLDHMNGSLRHIVFKNGTISSLKAIYAQVPFAQHCDIPQSLGCEFIGDGYLKIDGFQQTTVKGVFACGDNASRMRTVANAVAMGTTAGMTVSKELILNEFN